MGNYSGWFHHGSTTSLYAPPCSAIDADLAELAGGTDRLAAQTGKKLDEDRPRDAMHLLDIALHVDAASRAALAVKKKSLERLFDLSGGSKLSEAMWLRSEIAETEAALLRGR